ncbi:methanogenic corrinoid protein MtbC1 [Alkalibacillus flavidus]|uniref:Methanogenic corrinoid protein MtbC1 n=1 Tax=Alkalibacillus flavidus TaxID=546021 RepID=A0ABV2KWE2_9BACI
MYSTDSLTQYYEAILSGNTDQAYNIIQSVVKEHPTVDAYRLIAHAMYDVGKHWQTNELSVAQEHLATAVSQFVITQLTIHAIESKQQTLQSVALFSIETNQHNLGIQIIRNLFLEQGFVTYFYGADVPNHHIMESLKDVKPDYICYSVTLPNHLTKAKELGELIRQEPSLNHTGIVIGGYALMNHPHLRNQLVHDYYFDSIEDLHQWILEEGE